MPDPLPVMYGKLGPIAAHASCLICEADPHLTVVDHCHAHGWVRGTLCRRCNSVMSSIDRRVLPGSSVEDRGLGLGAFLLHYARCHECPPLATADLFPKGSSGTTSAGLPPTMKQERKTPYVTVNITPEARDLLRTAAVELTGPAGRKVSMSDALIALARAGQKNPGPVVAEVPAAEA